MTAFRDILAPPREASPGRPCPWTYRGARRRRDRWPPGRRSPASRRRWFARRSAGPTARLRAQLPAQLLVFEQQLHLVGQRVDVSLRDQVTVEPVGHVERQARPRRTRSPACRRPSPRARPCRTTRNATAPPPSRPHCSSSPACPGRVEPRKVTRSSIPSSCSQRLQPRQFPVGRAVAGAADNRQAHLALQRGPFLRNTSAMARISVSMPLIGWMRPTKSIMWWSGGMPTDRVPWPLRTAWAGTVSRSTPGGTIEILAGSAP